MNPATLEYLTTRFEISKRLQTSRGIQFQLTFEEYLALWNSKPRHVRKLAGCIKRGTVTGFMRSKDGFVLTWKHKHQRDTGVIDFSNADITTKNASRKRFQFIKGDRHSEASKRKISMKKKGKPFKDNDTRKARIADAMRGKEQTEEAKAIRSAAAKVYWARKRAEKEAAAPAVVETPTMEVTPKEVVRNEQLIIVSRQLEEASAGYAGCIDEWRAARERWYKGIYDVAQMRDIVSRKQQYEARRDLAAHLIAAHDRGECMVMARLQWTGPSE